MTESDIPGRANLVVGFGYVDEVKVVEELLPVLKVCIAGIKFPRGRPAQQDVNDVPRAKHRAGQARMTFIGIPIDNESPAQHWLPGPGRVVLLCITPQCSGARI